MQSHCPKEKLAPHRPFPMLWYLTLQHSHAASECLGPNVLLNRQDGIPGEGNVNKMVEPSEGAVDGTSLPPACEVRAQDHASLTELLGSKYMPVLKNAKGKLKLQDHSAMNNVGVCSRRITADLISSINTFWGGTIFRTLSNDHPSTPRLCTSSKKCSHKLIPAALRRIMGPVRLSGRFPLGFLICCSFYMQACFPFEYQSVWLSGWDLPNKNAKFLLRTC